MQTDNRIQIGKSSVQNASNFSSSRAASWMQSAGIESFAVDDCVMILGSENFQGWTSTDLTVSIDKAPILIPTDLVDVIRDYKSQAMGAKHDGLGLRVISLTPGFKDSPGLHVILSRVQFSSHFTITTLLDKMVLKATDGTISTIREKYGSAALQYSAFDHPVIPTSISLQIAVITNDNQLLLMQRSSHVAFYPNTWTVSIEEGMQADDKDFVQGALRGIAEELGAGIEVVVL